VPPDVVAFGEIGLAGEVRGVPRVSARLSEAAAMGFGRAIVPDMGANFSSTKLEILRVRTVDEALAAW
jgi:DNA repair protein RadA/Sms